MSSAARHSAAALVLLLAAARLHAAPAPPPKLVVLIVVDQMRGDYVDRYGFQWTSGLRRLVDGGAWFRRASYRYLTTVTCAGHATVSTGTYPRRHGMVNNAWFDRGLGRGVGCTSDAGAAIVSYAAPVAGGESPSTLMVPTLSDEMRVQLPAPARVVTMSMKERTAITLAGHRADAATWFSAAAGGFVTSSAYTAAPVPFVAEYVKSHPVAADLGKAWVRLLPVDRYLFTDAGTGEKPAPYWTSEFPHPLAGKGRTPDAQFYEAWEESPFSDDYLGRLAIASVDALKLGQGAGTDYLGISFSTLDLVGHEFGPRSHEVQDVLARLDRTLGGLLDHLDRAVGEGKYVVALTADHGAPPIPEQVAALGLNAGRLDAVAVRQAAQAALEAALGPGAYTIVSQYSDLVLEPDVVEKLARDPRAVDAVLRAITAVPGVATAFFSQQLGALAAAGDPEARAAQLGYYPGRSGDLIVIPKPYWFFVIPDGTAEPGSATTHGTSYAYDQHVPVVLYGAGVKPGEYLRAVSPVDIAPTLAYMCGVTLAFSDGDVLAEALAPSAPAAQQGR